MSGSVPTLVIGYGNMGTKHARVLTELGGPSALWGIVDPDPARFARAQADHPRTRVFTTLLAALEGSDRPGCAIVAASTRLHYELVQALLAQRVPTLVEKPITASVAQAEALIQLAHDTGTPFTVGHIERFNPAAVAARQIVSERLIGEVIQLCFRRVGGSPADVVASQDVLFDLAVHDYDLACFITGSSLEIIAALGHEQEGHLDSALVLGRMGTGASMQLQVNWRTPVKVRRIELTGTTGYAEINLITQQVTLYKQNPLLSSHKVPPDSHPYFDDYLRSFALPDRVELGINRREPLREELAAFWRSLLSGAPLVVNAAEAMSAVRLTEITHTLLKQRAP